ncbi:hypothetical protein SNE40_016058 [Patella caerulea]|uniref:IgGFc-binding protein N-terminal domain-containing protein n=1 Tax=Patella caerulea TaxID=87958 RepID=A0AAN8J8M5_PATCE
MAIRAVFVLSLLFGKSVNLVNSQSSFYVAFFPGSYNDSTTTSDHHNSLFISSSVSEAGTTCNISYDDDSRQEITININPNLVTKHELPAKTRMSSGVKIANKGVRVQCSKNVSLYGLSDGDFTAIPTESLSQEYIVPGFQSNSFLGVVGTSENTTLDIFIKSTCSYKYGGTAYGNGDVLTVLLQENDVLQITDQDQASGDGCDLGGSRIVASSKVSVFSGTVYYEDGGSHFFLQVPPLAAFSTETIVPRVQTSYPRKNIIRVIAAKNYTILYLPRSTRVLMSGDFVDSTFNFTEDQVITSLLPVLVTQTCLFGPSGGFSTVVPGQDLYQNDYLIQVLGKDLRQEDPYLTVISKTSAIRDLKVNGVYPNNINWVNVTRAPVPYSVGDLHIDAGQQLHISSTSPIFVREHEYNMKNTHGYIGGYDIPRDTSSNHQGRFG